MQDSIAIETGEVRHGYRGILMVKHTDTPVWLFKTARDVSEKTMSLALYAWLNFLETSVDNGSLTPSMV